jgi:hypothetical protein
MDEFEQILKFEFLGPRERERKRKKERERESKNRRRKVRQARVIAIFPFMA